MGAPNTPADKQFGSGTGIGTKIADGGDPPRGPLKREPAERIVLTEGKYQKDGGKSN